MSVPVKREFLHISPMQTNDKSHLLTSGLQVMLLVRLNILHKHVSVRQNMLTAKEDRHRDPPTVRETRLRNCAVRPITVASKDAPDKLF